MTDEGFKIGSSKAKVAVESATALYNGPPSQKMKSVFVCSLSYLSKSSKNV